ncbi:MAG: hypothetical protein ACM3SY_09320 [Candidatus Omnitrophota bacterium]
MSPAMTIILFIAIVIVVVSILMVAIALVPAINQLRFLFKDLEKTSGEIRELVGSLKTLSDKIDQDIDKVEVVLDHTMETVEMAKHSLTFINENVLNRSAKLIAIIPAAKFAWNIISKLKRRCHK